MENEEKEKKSSNKPMLVILLAVVLIIAGIALVVTGNNKSLLGSNEDKEEKEEQPEEPEEPDKSIPDRKLSDDVAQEILVGLKRANLPEETWTVGSTSVIGEGLEDSFLVHYQQIDSDGNLIAELETIIFVVGDTHTAELPGWTEGEKDLSQYEFVIYEEAENPVVTPKEPEEQQPADEQQPVVEEQQTNQADTQEEQPAPEVTPETTPENAE